LDSFSRESTGTERQPLLDEGKAIATPLRLTNGQAEGLPGWATVHRCVRPTAVPTRDQAMGVSQRLSHIKIGVSAVHLPERWLGCCVNTSSRPGGVASLVTYCRNNLACHEE